jgi:egghead protein (zeste-white 4 protein)
MVRPVDDRVMKVIAGEVPRKQTVGLRSRAVVARKTGDASVARFSSALLVVLFVGVIVVKAVWQRNDIVVSQPRWELLNLFWLVYVPPILVGIVGLIVYRNTAAPAHAIDNLVSYRIISRGQNFQALLQTIDSIGRVMRENPLFAYRIEVVTDLAVKIPSGVRHFLMPANYRTARGTMYKARAMQYALEHSDLRPDAWIMHLDEESEVTPSVVNGIAAAVAEEEKSGQHRIGQGAILYHRLLDRHPFLTLADSLRTADDLGRFYLQYRFGKAVFGMHGSFILVRNSVEKAVGFDLGPEGSITEDTYWSLVLSASGHGFRWVDGYILEQSTQSLADFLKQRRRWFLGLTLAVVSAPAPWKEKAVLGASLVTWASTLLAWPITIADLVTGTTAPEWIQIAASFALAGYATHYLVGLFVNLNDRQVYGWKRLCLYVFQILALPVYSVMESAAVIYAVLRPDFAGFHVVEKNAEARIQVAA